MKNALWLLPLLAIALVPLAHQAQAMDQNNRTEPNLTTVPNVDLPRYMGRWYVISHVPTFLEKHKVGTSDNYSLLPDGTLRVDFAFHKKTLDAPEEYWKGSGKILNHTTNAAWKVRLIWPFTASYRILELDPNYQWAVATTDSGDMMWVLSRTETLPAPVYERIREKIADRGLDPTNLEMVPQ